MRAVVYGSALALMLALIMSWAANGLAADGPVPPPLQARPGALFTPVESRAYRACLFAAWIEDYCYGNSARWTSTYERVFASCIAANGGGRFPLEGRTVLNTDDYCWAAAHDVVWHRH